MLARYYSTDKQINYIKSESKITHKSLKRTFSSKIVTQNWFQDLKNDIIAAFPFLPSEIESAHYYLNDSSGLVPKSQVLTIIRTNLFSWNRLNLRACSTDTSWKSST